MSEETTTQEVTPEGGVTLEAIEGLLRAANEQTEQRLQAEFDAKLDELKAPKRDDVPEYVNRHGEKVAKVRNASERRYARLSEGEREWRDDESDHWAAQWIRGMMAKNSALTGEADAKLREYYGRATTAEGTAPTTGALSDGTGASLLPIPLAELVMIARDKRSVARRLFRSITMMEQTRRITTVGAATAEMLAEEGTPTQGEPAFATKVLIAKKMQVTCKATEEELADSAFDLVSIYAQRAGAAMGALEDVQVATSNGTAPNIQEALSGTAHAEATSTVMIYQDLVSQFFATPEPHRMQSIWLGNAVTLELISTLMDGNDRAQVIGNNSNMAAVTDVGGIGTLLNRPVVEFPLADGALWFGEPSAAYAIGARQGLQTSMSEHVEFLNGRVVFKFNERLDGVNLDPAAATLTTGYASVA